MAGGIYSFQVGDFPPLSFPKHFDPKNITLSIPVAQDRISSKIENAKNLASPVVAPSNGSVLPLNQPTDRKLANMVSSKDPHIADGPKILEESKMVVSNMEKSFLGSFSIKPIHQINGKPCITFKMEDKIRLLSGMKHIVVVKFSHFRPKFIEFNTFLKHLSFRGCYKILEFDLKHIFVEFEIFEDFIKLWMLKSYVIGGFRGRFFQWDSDFLPSIESPIAPVWVHLPHLPLYLFDEEAMLSVASLFGKPILFDSANMNRNKVGVMSFCVAKDVRIKGPSEIFIEFVGDGILVDRLKLVVVYGAIPDFCSNCQHIGHNLVDCKVFVDKGLGKKVVGVVNTAENSGDIPLPSVFHRINVGLKSNGEKHANKEVMDIVTVEDASDDEGAGCKGKVGVSGLEDTTLQLHKQNRKSDSFPALSLGIDPSFSGATEHEMVAGGSSLSSSVDVQEHRKVLDIKEGVGTELSKAGGTLICAGGSSSKVVSASFPDQGGDGALGGRSGDVCRWLGKGVWSLLEQNFLPIMPLQAAEVDGKSTSNMMVSNKFGVLSQEVEEQGCTAEALHCTEGVSLSFAQQVLDVLHQIRCPPTRLFETPSSSTKVVIRDPNTKEEISLTKMYSADNITDKSDSRVLISAGLSKNARKKLRKKTKHAIKKDQQPSFEAFSAKEDSVSVIASPTNLGCNASSEAWDGLDSNAYKGSPFWANYHASKKVASVFTGFEDYSYRFSLNGEDGICMGSTIPKHSRLHPSFKERHNRDNSLDYLDLHGMCSSKNKAGDSKGQVLFETSSKAHSSSSVSLEEEVIETPKIPESSKAVSPAPSTSWAVEFEAQDRADFTRSLSPITRHSSLKDGEDSEEESQDLDDTLETSKFHEDPLDPPSIKVKPKTKHMSEKTNKHTYNLRSTNKAGLDRHGDNKSKFEKHMFLPP